MKYFCSDMRNPSPWRETSETDERTVIENYFDDQIKVWDADNCGTKVIYFAFDSGKFFRLTYDWWCDPESEEYIKDEYELAAVKREEAQGICEDRDWMTPQK